MGKIDKYIARNLWYHGTTLAAWKNMCKNGVLADYNKGFELDFGYGFYLTPEFSQAERYITNLSKFDLSSFSSAFNDEENILIVIEFEFELEKYYAHENYIFGIFDKYDDTFAKFVFHNRTINVYGEFQHSYDIIFGVMSDSLPLRLIQEYNNKEKTYNEVIESLKKSTSAKQLSLHSQALCDIIKPTKVVLLDTRKELNIDEYCKKN